MFAPAQRDDVAAEAKRPAHFCPRPCAPPTTVVPVVPLIATFGKGSTRERIRCGESAAEERSLAHPSRAHAKDAEVQGRGFNPAKTGRAMAPYRSRRITRAKLSLLPSETRVTIHPASPRASAPRLRNPHRCFVYIAAARAEQSIDLGRMQVIENNPSPMCKGGTSRRRQNSANVLCPTERSRRLLRIQSRSAFWDGRPEQPFERFTLHTALAPRRHNTRRFERISGVPKLPKARQDLRTLGGLRFTSGIAMRANARHHSRRFTRAKSSFLLASRSALNTSHWAPARSIHVRVETIVSYWKQMAGRPPNRYTLVMAHNALFHVFDARISVSAAGASRMLKP